MLGELVVVAALACLAVLAGAYWRVPLGPECPRCGALTLEGRSRLSSMWPSVDRLLIAVQCPVCGWDGHTRRRPPVTEVARLRRRGRP